GPRTPAHSPPRAQEHHGRRRPCERQLQQHHDHHHRRAGQCHRLELGRHDGLQGQPQVDPLCRPGRRRGRGPQGRRPRRPHAGGRGQGPGLGPRKRAAGAAGGWFPDHLHPRRDPDPAQRRPPEQAPAGL
ncbi:MAG: SSU ribosomal protein S11p (S14e), partial [uncultured Sphingomonas sp.]